MRFPMTFVWAVLSSKRSDEQSGINRKTESGSFVRVYSTRRKVKAVHLNSILDTILSGFHFRRSWNYSSGTRLVDARRVYSLVRRNWIDNPGYPMVSP